jgi:hypothetical protein
MDAGDYRKAGKYLPDYTASDPRKAIIFTVRAMKTSYLTWMRHFYCVSILCRTRSIHSEIECNHSVTDTVQENQNIWLNHGNGWGIPGIRIQNQCHNKIRTVWMVSSRQMDCLRKPGGRGVTCGYWGLMGSFVWVHPDTHEKKKKSPLPIISFACW